MGKSKANKYKSKSNNPTGVPTLKEIEMEEGELLVPISANAGSMESLIEKLQSQSSEERECAAVIIANMVDNKDFVENIIKKKVLRIAAPLLLDRNLSVRHSIAGCLRNVAVCGGYHVCEAMVNQDIMTSLIMLLEQYKDPWAPEKTVENTIDSKAAIFLEACNLLWVLCENSDKAVSLFNKNNVVDILFPCLNTEIYKLQIPIAVAQCLHTVGENNNHLSTVLKETLIEEQLKALMTLPPTCSEHILLQVLGAGIKLNIFAGKLKECMNDVTSPIVTVIFSVFKEPFHSALKVLSEQNAALKIKQADRYHDEKELEEKFTAVKTGLTDLLNLISAKQMALEILGNIFDDDPDESWEDISSSDVSEIEGSGMEVDEADVLPEEIGLGMSTEIYKSMVAENLLERVTEQIINPADETLQSLKADSKLKDCLKRIDTLRCTALLCLNNIVQKGTIDDLGGSSKLTELWLYLADLLFKETDLNNVDQVEAVTRTMSAALRKLAEAKCTSQFNSMTEPDLQLIFNICEKSDDCRVKVHIFRILGTIGCILGDLNTPNSSALIKVIGSLLLDVCCKNENLWVVAEVMDVLFDMFAEDHLDSIAQEIHLVEKFSHMVPVFKSKLKLQKKSLGDHLPVIQTAKDNLIRFIDYKKNLKT